MPTVHVYSMEVTAKDLEEKARLLGESFFWTTNLSSFKMGKGFPKDWSDQGSIFSSIGELQWQRKGEKYQVLIFADQALEGLDTLTVKDEWESVEENIFLQDLSEPKVRPLFEKYPHGNVAGFLKVRTCKRNGMIVCISPREFISKGAPK